MVLQICNVLTQKYDYNVNNNNNRDSDPLSHFYYEPYLQIFSNFENIEHLFGQSSVVLYDCDSLLDSDSNNNNNNDQELNSSDVTILLEILRKRNKKIIFTTNRSDKTRRQMLLQLNSLGIEANLNEMFPTSYTTAVYLKAIGFERQVFVVGSDAIRQELSQVGLQSTGLCGLSSPKEMDLGFATYNLNPRVGAVVVSFDHQIGLPHLVKACSYATKRDCLFIVANNGNFADSEPTSQVAAIQVAANKGFIPLSKSHRLYYHCIRQMHSDFDPKKAIIITNRMSTDLIFCKNIGIKTVLIESKNYLKVNPTKTRTDFKHYKPDCLVDSLSSLTQLLSK